MILVNKKIEDHLLIVIPSPNVLCYRIRSAVMPYPLNEQPYVICSTKLNYDIHELYFIMYSLGNHTSD